MVSARLVGFDIIRRTFEVVFNNRLSYLLTCKWLSIMISRTSISSLKSLNTRFVVNTSYTSCYFCSGKMPSDDVQSAPQDGQTPAETPRIVEVYETRLFHP